jgi:hypothetical protein
MAMATPPPADPAQAAAVRLYTVISLMALLVLLLVLLEKGMGEWSLLPVALGCMALLLHLGFGPPMVLLALIWLLLSEGLGFDPFRLTFSLRGRSASEMGDLDLGDIALSAAVLIFSVGFYRMQSLVHHLFPIDSRRRHRGSAAGVPPIDGHLEKRSVASVEPVEFPWLVGAGFAWSLAAWAFWQWLMGQQPLWGFDLTLWRTLILFWLVSTGLLLTTALLGYLTQIGAGPEGNAVYLQDQLWQQTRGEQSRINRWLVWARLRWQRLRSSERQRGRNDKNKEVP